MVIVITKEELKNDPLLVEKLKKSVFIYPTDTIYGIGCDATNKELVGRVRKIKQSSRQPFSIIVPDKEMISKNCVHCKHCKEWLDKLPGRYTLIMKIKKRR